MHVRTFDGRGFHTVDQPDWSVLLNSKDEMVLWVDLSAPNIDDLMKLEQVFKFHPLAIEDAATKFQRPKIESYSDHLFMILNSVHLMKDDLVFTEVDMFIGANYLVTVHSGQEMLINEVARRCDLRASFDLGVTVGYLVYVVIDTLVDSYFPILDAVGDEIDTLSEHVLRDPQPALLERLFRLKRDVNELWRIAGYQRDLFVMLSRDDQRWLRDEALRYFLRDVYDHMLRASDTINALREAVSGVLDLYVTSQSNRLSLVVWRLTIFTVVIGAMTVIGGFYGMNFTQTFPPFDAPWGVPFILGLMIVTALVLARLLNRQR